MRESPAVLVTSGHSRVGYTVARQLALAGIRVYVGDTGSQAMAFWSRYIRGSFTYPSPFSAPDEFLDCIRKKGHELGFEVVVPVLEEGFLWAKHAASLCGQFRFSLPDYSTLLSVHDKVELSKACAQYGIHSPRIVTLVEIAEDNRLAHELRYPVLVKPRQGGGGWAVREFAEPLQVLEIVAAGRHLDLPLWRFFVQEKIAGSGVGIAVLYDTGRCVATIGYRQVRSYPVGHGQPTFRAGVECPSAEGQLHKLLDGLRWNGVCQADFLLEETTGTPYLIDVNPRYWGSTGHAIAAGANIPLMHYCIAAGQGYLPSPEIDASAKSRWLGGDLMSFVGSLRRSRTKLRFLQEFIFSGASYYDDFSFKDPLPFFFWIADTLRRKSGIGFSRQRVADCLEGVWE